MIKFDFTELFKKQEKNVYLQVKDSNDLGIVTYVSPDVKNFNKAYKQQMISFLKGIINLLEKGDK